MNELKKKYKKKKEGKSSHLIKRIGRKALRKER